MTPDIVSLALSRDDWLSIRAAVEIAVEGGYFDTWPDPRYDEPDARDRFDKALRDAIPEEED